MPSDHFDCAILSLSPLTRLQVHPTVVNHLLALQPSFGFPDRQLDDLALLRGESDAQEAQDAAMDTAEEWMEHHGDQFQDVKKRRAEVKKRESSCVPECSTFACSLDYRGGGLLVSSFRLFLSVHRVLQSC